MSDTGNRQWDALQDREHTRFVAETGTAPHSGITAEQVIKFDNKTGSTHMTDREQWGYLMAGQINEAEHECPTGDHDDCTPMIVMDGPAPQNDADTAESLTTEQLAKRWPGPVTRRGQNDAERLQALSLILEIERNCPCGHRPEAQKSHPHVSGCPVDKLKQLLAAQRQTDTGKEQSEPKV